MECKFNNFIELPFTYDLEKFHKDDKGRPSKPLSACLININHIIIVMRFNHTEAAAEALEKNLSAEEVAKVDSECISTKIKLSTGWHNIPLSYEEVKKRISQTVSLCEDAEEWDGAAEKISEFKILNFVELPLETKFGIQPSLINVNDFSHCRAPNDPDKTVIYIGSEGFFVALKYEELKKRIIFKFVENEDILPWEEN